MAASRPPIRAGLRVNGCQAALLAAAGSMLVCSGAARTEANGRSPVEALPGKRVKVGFGRSPKMQVPVLAGEDGCVPGEHARLVERKGLRGTVLCVGLDPPYRIRPSSGFQWSAITHNANADVKALAQPAGWHRATRARRVCGLRCQAPLQEERQRGKNGAGA